MIIKETEKIPFGYGFVRVCWEHLNAYEILPIPICWIKRFWYWTLHKTKLFNWEEEIRKFQKDQRDTIRKDQWDTIIRILENLDRISIRAKVKGEWWDSFTLKELIMVGEEKQVINWIKDLFNL